MTDDKCPTISGGLLLEDLLDAGFDKPIRNFFRALADFVGTSCADDDWMPAGDMLCLLLSNEYPVPTGKGYAGDRKRQLPIPPDECARLLRALANSMEPDRDPKRCKLVLKGPPGRRTSFLYKIACERHMNDKVEAARQGGKLEAAIEQLKTESGYSESSIRRNRRASGQTAQKRRNPKGVKKH